MKEPRSVAAEPSKSSVCARRGLTRNFFRNEADSALIAKYSVSGMPTVMPAGWMFSDVDLDLGLLMASSP